MKDRKAAKERAKHKGVAGLIELGTAAAKKIAQNPRLMWLPRLPPMPEQCVSCPFREGNELEFRAVLTKLKNLGGSGLVVSLDQTIRAKEMIRREAIECGEFSCHQSAYDSKMRVKPYSEHRQCPGASSTFVQAGWRK